MSKRMQQAPGSTQIESGMKKEMPVRCVGPSEGGGQGAPTGALGTQKNFDKGPSIQIPGPQGGARGPDRTPKHEALAGRI
jgi:hypothetical protein